MTAAEALAWLRIGGTIIVAIAVLLGPADHGGAFVAALAVTAAYAIALAVLAALGLRKAPRVEVSLADVGFILLLIATSGGALSEARLALVVYPRRDGARALRSLDRVRRRPSAAIGFSAVSLTTLDEPGAQTAFIETLAAMVIVGAIGVALATAFQRRTRQIEELGSGRAALLHEALDAEERERARIGERLHDDTLQSLLAAQQDVREARAGYLQSLEFADEALTDSVRALRETVLGLHPASLHERGLELGLRVEVDRVARRARIATELKVDPEAVGSHDALLYAAARELITNVVKHASASRMTVTLAREPEAIVLTRRGRRRRHERRDRAAPRRSPRGTSAWPPRAGASAPQAAGWNVRRGARRGDDGPHRRARRARSQRQRRRRPRRRPRPPGGAARDRPARQSPRRGLRPHRAPRRRGCSTRRSPASALVDAERVFLLSQTGAPEPYAARREWPLTHSPCRFVVSGRRAARDRGRARRPAAARRPGRRASWAWSPTRACR